MSGQYSSAVGVQGLGNVDSTTSRWLRSMASSATSRLSARDRIWLRSLCSLLTIVPSGRLMRTAGTSAPGRGVSTRAARKSNSPGYLRGFLALASLSFHTTSAILQPGGDHGHEHDPRADLHARLDCRAGYQRPLAGRAVGRLPPLHR